MLDDSDKNADSRPTNDHIRANLDSVCSEEDGDWSAPLWDENWDGDVAGLGEARLFVAMKKWEDSTEDVLIAHYPEVEDGGMPTAYAHRHGNDVAPLTAHGPADDVVEIVTRQWEPPRAEEGA